MGAASVQVARNVTENGDNLYTVSEAKKATPPVARHVNLYERVTDLIGTNDVNLDTIYGGAPQGGGGGTSDGDDWYIAVQTSSDDEVVDFDSSDKDAVLEVPGDMDFDGDVDFDDISPFSTALNYPSTYFTTYGLGGYVHGDMDDDGDLDFDDIDPFNDLFS